MARLAACEWRVELGAEGGGGGAAPAAAVLTLALAQRTAQRATAAADTAAAAPAARVVVQLDRAALAELAASVDAIESAIGACVRFAASCKCMRALRMHAAP